MHSVPYSDSPKPVIFSTASTFDPLQFSRMTEYATELLGGERSGKTSPVEVAAWLDGYAEAAKTAWAVAEKNSPQKQGPAYRRLKLDIALQIGLAKFYATRFRSGVLFAIYEQTKDGRALRKSVDLYKDSRAIWAKAAEGAREIYMTDITVGEQPYQRGHWLDRLPAMDKDISQLEEMMARTQIGTESKVTNAISAALTAPIHQPVKALHVPPGSFNPGVSLDIKITTETVESVKLYYRHVDQAERYVEMIMRRIDNGFRATIPGSYTNSPYPLQYFFEMNQMGGETRLFPGFDALRMNQPYFVVRKG